MKTILFSFFGFFLAGFVFLVASLFFPWSRVDWGNFSLKPSRTVTVVGEARSQKKAK